MYINYIKNNYYKLLVYFKVLEDFIKDFINNWIYMYRRQSLVLFNNQNDIVFYYLRIFILKYN